MEGRRRRELTSLPRPGPVDKFFTGESQPLEAGNKCRGVNHRGTRTHKNTPGFVFQGLCISVSSFKAMKLCARLQTLNCKLCRDDSYRHGLMGSGGYHWKYEERGKRKRLRGRGNLGLSDKPQRGLLTPLVVLALSSHLTVRVSFILPRRTEAGLF